MPTVNGSDGGTFLASDLYGILENYNNTLPLSTKIKVSEIEMPYVMIADDAYRLNPYSKKKSDTRRNDN